jgi:hypothetical protein
MVKHLNQRQPAIRENAIKGQQQRRCSVKIKGKLIIGCREMDSIIFLEFIYPKGNSHLAGIGTLDSPGCQRVLKPVSRLFCINPLTIKK